jgi:hypothetical protein
VGFFDDLEALGRLAKDVTTEFMADDANVSEAPRAKAPSLFFDCVCGRRWLFPLDSTSPTEVVRWVEHHVATCPPARAYVAQRKQLGAG